MKQNFEQFLMEKHAEGHMGTKDSMVDGFSDWLTELSADEFIEYGDKFAKEQSKDLLEACKSLFNYFRHSDDMPELLEEQTEQAIIKAEESK